MKIVVKKKVLEDYILELLNSEDYPSPHDAVMPAVVNEPPMEEEPVVVVPATETQVSDFNMPIGDDDWIPGNNNELTKAASQLVEQVPEGHREWFWHRLQRLVEKTTSSVMGPGTGDMEYEDTPEQDLPTDKQAQRPTETWGSRQGVTTG